MMGCASSQSGNLPGTTTATGLDQSADMASPVEPSTDSESSTKYPPAEAFEIALDDVDDNENDGRSDSLIKKHPPKRLQKLVEQAATTAVPPTTIEHLEEKLAKAEVRRQQYMQQKIENIITLTGKGPGPGSIGSRSNGKDASDGDENDGNDGNGGNDENDVNRVGGDNIENNGQNDEHNEGGNASVDGEAVIVSSSRDGDVQSTSNTPAASVNEQSPSAGDHDPDNRAQS